MKVLRDIVNRLRLRYRFCELSVRNLISSQRVTGMEPVVVSLTSHCQRVENVWATIESIAQGRVRPYRLILWLSEKDSNRSLGRKLKRLRQRGLEVRYARDVGPHTKYFYSIDIALKNQIALVTADDDVLYSPCWLANLLEGFNRSPRSIVCYRARWMLFDETKKLRTYLDWPYVECGFSHPRVFLTGVSGVVYPTSFLKHLKDFGDGFLTTCLKADDVWLNYVAAKTHTPVRQLHEKAIDFAILPGSQSVALWDSNSIDGNNIQLANTYDEATLKFLYSA